MNGLVVSRHGNRRSTQASGPHSVILGPGAAAALGNLLEMHISRPHSDLLNPLKMASRRFYQSLQAILRHVQFGNYWLGPFLLIS